MIFADEARGWRNTNVTSRWNHGAGLSFGPETLIEAGSFSHNGQIGIAGSGGEDSRIEGAAIAADNHASYKAAWEPGGNEVLGYVGVDRPEYVRAP